MHVREAIRIWAWVVFIPWTTLANASAGTDRIIEVETSERVYQFVIHSLDDHGLKQAPYLNPSFQRQFKTVRDLDERSVLMFLKQHPDNRDALLEYVIALPNHLVTEAMRLRFIALLAGFDPEFESKPPVMINREIRPPLALDSRATELSANIIRTQHIGFEHKHPAKMLDNPIIVSTGRRDSGFDFRFYRGLRFEYHFEAPVSLRFDVGHQRFGINWTFE